MAISTRFAINASDNRSSIFLETKRLVSPYLVYGVKIRQKFGEVNIVLYWLINPLSPKQLDSGSSVGLYRNIHRNCNGIELVLTHYASQ